MKKNIVLVFTIGFLLYMAGCGGLMDSAIKNDINSEAEGAKDRDMQIVVEGEQGELIMFQLYDNTAAKSFYDQLPMTIDVEDYSDNEKIFYPPKKLDIGNATLAKGSAGTFAYYEPWGDVVMFYDDFSGSSGLYALGEVTSGGEQIVQLSNTIKISNDTAATVQEK